MSRSVGISVENTFSKGFLTEFSGLNFPENACLDILNCVTTETGEVYRRDHIDREYGYVMNSIPMDPSTDAVSSYVWSGVGLLGDINFIVIQIGQTIHFWNTNIGGSSLSGSKKSFTINLETLKVLGAPDTGTQKCSFASGSGKLFVAHGYCQPFYISYDEGYDAVIITPMDIKIRDFTVLSDSLGIDEKPSTDIANHRYNLMNQGWTFAQIVDWYTSNTNYPSKAQIPWYYRNETTNIYDFAPANSSKYPYIGGSLAPRGYLILDAFQQDRTTISGVYGLPIVSSGYQRPTTVAFMNSRVFYSGVNADSFSSTLYFSSILKANSDDLQFHQRNDPTSEIANELLPNDGGTIVIPEAETIVALYATKTYLIVFATNGLWAIGGSEGVGFTASDYMVQRISDIPVPSRSSVLIVDNTPIWWNTDGIYMTSVGLENLQVQSLTKDSIQSFYDTIPSNCKKSVKPVFNRLSSEVQWLYSSDENNPTIYDSLLILKTTTKAFYKHLVSTTYCSIVDAVVSELDSTGTEESISTIFLVKNEDETTFATFIEGSHIDWITFGNTEAFDSYLVPAYRVRGDAIRQFQVNYIEVYSRVIDNSSCFLRGVWDYANNYSSNDYTSYQQVVPANTSNRNIVSRKLRLRGSGKTINFEFRSDGYKPFHLVGWITQDIVNDGL